MKPYRAFLFAFLFALGWSAVTHAEGVIYVLTAPYYTVRDGVTAAQLRDYWSGEDAEPFSCLSLSADTLIRLSRAWGRPRGAKLIFAEPARLMERTVREGCWAILPFEELTPRWKVMRIDDTSPLTFQFEPDNYALSLPLRTGEESNFQPNKLTTLNMTGTTAMARYLAYYMEEEGLLIPTEVIGDTLAAADLTHISNEASFSPDCPPGTPLRREARFCSDPSYMAVLRAAGTDIIELTGNHNLDWGPEPFLYSMDYYEKEGLLTYGGGRNTEEADAPLFIEHNGNKLVFLGCNAIGPVNVFATEETPGAARCDIDSLKAQVTALKAAGWLPIVTFQHLEYTWYDVPPLQSHDFYAVAEAGPVIISGSQAHIPQGMTFTGESFIHFGLGNLFFDQMSDVERTSFFDTHWFYDGRYIGNQLNTIILENYSRPRFLTPDERSAFLTLIFSNSPIPPEFGGFHE